jgi:hypothetical protein
VRSAGDPTCTPQSSRHTSTGLSHPRSAEPRSRRPRCCAPTRPLRWRCPSAPRDARYPKQRRGYTNMARAAAQTPCEDRGLKSDVGDRSRSTGPARSDSSEQSKRPRVSSRSQSPLRCPSRACHSPSCSTGLTRPSDAILQPDHRRSLGASGGESEGTIHWTGKPSGRGGARGKRPSRTNGRGQMINEIVERTFP